jgi:hypothetical protein
METSGLRLGRRRFADRRQATWSIDELHRRLERKLSAIEADRRQYRRRAADREAETRRSDTGE